MSRANAAFLSQALIEHGLASQQTTVEAVLELRLGSCAADSFLCVSATSPTAVSVSDTRGLAVIYPSPPQPLGVVMLPDRDLFVFVGPNELAIEGNEGDKRIILMSQIDPGFRAVASLGEEQGARAVFAALPSKQSYSIGVIALFTAESLFTKGEELFRSDGATEDALVLLERALALNPNMAPAWRRKAYIHRQLGEQEQALAAANRCVAVDPGFALGWRCKGAILRDRDEHQQGLACYERSLELDATDTLCWQNKGNALSALGRNEEASAAYAEARRVGALYPERL